MVPEDLVGRAGRALTEVGSAGRVEIDGRAYEAFAAQRLVPTGEAVVTGWRLAGESGYVLSVRPGDDGPSSPHSAGRSPAGVVNSPPQPYAPSPAAWSPSPSARPVAGGCGGCGLAAVGSVLGAALGAILPIHFDRVRGPGVEAVRLSVLGAEVRKSAGPPGELDRALRGVRTGLVAGLGLLGGAILGGAGAVVRGVRSEQ